jgi:hypothetical protein
MHNYRSKYTKNGAHHFKDNLLHRLDGPAIEYWGTPNRNEYWIDGRHITAEEWALVAFANGIKNRMLFK